MRSMEGKVAIVTGGGRGIGREECLLLALEGARVVVNDWGGEVDGSGGGHSPAQAVVRLIQESGGEAVANFEDVTSFDAAKRMVDCALSSFGRLDTLINNAGILRDRTLCKMSEQEFDSVVSVHLKGHFNCARWAAAHWREEHKAGRKSPRHIVNTTSTAGLIGNRGQTNYAAAKAGIASFTQTWAQELDSYGVTVNAIAPIARTRITEVAFGAMLPGEGEFDALDPANVAPLAVLLGSDRVGAISGEVFAIRGGTLERFEPWQCAEAIEKRGRWTLEELGQRLAELV